MCLLLFKKWPQKVHGLDWIGLEFTYGANNLILKKTLKRMRLCEAVSHIGVGTLILYCTFLRYIVTLVPEQLPYYNFVFVFVSEAVTGGGAWQAECQSCPLISQECPTPAPGPDYLHSVALASCYKPTCLLQPATRSVEMWAGRRPNSLPTPVSELSITKPTLGSLPRASKEI